MDGSVEYAEFPGPIVTRALGATSPRHALELERDELGWQDSPLVLPLRRREAAPLDDYSPLVMALAIGLGAPAAPSLCTYDPAAAERAGGFSHGPFGAFPAVPLEN
jgi:hypothetical protein